MESVPSVYEFGGFLLDPDERVLSRDNMAVPLTPKATDILITLVERRGHIVEKAELMRQVWPDTAVEESNLTQNIYALRKVLVDAEGRSPFIETVPRRGYRFVTAVRIVPRSDAGIADPTAEVTAAICPSEASLPRNLTRGGTESTAAVATSLREPRRWWSIRNPIGWLVPALATTALGLAVLSMTSDRSQPGGTVSELPSRVSRVTNLGSVVRATISRDGRVLVYALSTSPRESLWVRDIDSPKPTQLIEPAVGTYRRGGGLSSGPNGWVYYTWFRPDLAATGVFRIPERGGRPEPLQNVRDLPSFEPRGERFACITTGSTIRESRLLVYDDAGASPRVVARRTPPATFLQMPPAWSPDAKQLAAWTLNAHTPDVRDLVIVNVDDGRERVVTKQNLHAVDGMVWVPDGQTLIVAARERASSPLRLWQIPLEAPVMRPLTTDTSDYRLAGLTQGPRLAAVRVEIARHLWVGPVKDLSAARQVASDAGELSELESIAWMPDGRVLYTSAESGNADIWVYDPGEDVRRQLTTDPRDDFSPASSPDGRTIVFASDRSGATGLWAISSDGESSARQITNGGDSRPSVAPDGRVVFQRGVIQSSPIQLWRIPLEGGAAVQITEGISIRPSVSPDGRLVAYYWLTPERWTLAVQRIDGGEPLQQFPLSSTHCGRTVRWSPDNRALAYIDCEGGVANIWLRGLDGSPPRKLTDFRSGDIATFDWSRDGSQLAWITRSQVSDVVLVESPAATRPRSSNMPPRGPN